MIDKKICSPLNQNLAKTLKLNNIPIECECGYKCDCGTCAIYFNDLDDYEDINVAFKQSVDEKLVLMNKCAAVRLYFFYFFDLYFKIFSARLSCILQTCDELNGKTIYL